MNKKEAIKLLEEAYPDLKANAVVEDPDLFIVQMERKDGTQIVGGVKGIYKEDGRIVAINPLRIKGLVKRLMAATI